MNTYPKITKKNDGVYDHYYITVLDENCKLINIRLSKSQWHVIKKYTQHNTNYIDWLCLINQYVANKHKPSQYETEIIIKSLLKDKTKVSLALSKNLSLFERIKLAWKVIRK